MEHLGPFACELKFRSARLLAGEGIPSPLLGVRSRIEADRWNIGADFVSRYYSYRSASIGFSRAAFSAGKNPDTIPTSDRITNEIIITLSDACRKIAPS